MGFEASPPNEFRASVRRGGGPQIVAEKISRIDPSGDGLEAIKVDRSEKRLTDQRDGDRHRFGGQQTLIRYKGKKHSVDLINLSHGGAMVGGDFTAKLWDKVELVLGEGAAVECAVRWIRDGNVGLEFAHETRIDCDSATRDDLFREVIRNCFPGVEIKPREPIGDRPDQPNHKREATRHPLIWTGVLHHGTEWQDARLRNISGTGALIECSASVPDGAAVSLSLGEAGRIKARVSWSRGNQTGLVFDALFDVSRLAKATPILASKNCASPAPDGGDREQSPWAPEWKRLSIDELGAELGG